jgi:asparagine synthase (glutamine-hydrolysing)
MCGICGQFNFVRNEPVEPETIRRMTQTMVHRGPDDEGYFFDGPVGLGFRRLSIIDLAGGHQPMSDVEETVWIILNGEIYNYKELRAELEKRGHRFRTSSDTEVVVHGYKEWGTEVLNHLNGMFGLAIWDVQKKRLVVARDAMGIKLIYYRIADGQLTFGSEIRPILAAGTSQPEVDPVALNLFLRFRYTPSPLTIFDGIRKLAPGTMLIVEDGQYRERRWYDYTPVPFSSPKEDEDATHELLELYRAAVRRHLLSDVPVGILLSGGLDSAIIAALAERLAPSDVHCFSIGFDDPRYNELPHARRVLGVHLLVLIPVRIKGRFRVQDLAEHLLQLVEVRSLLGRQDVGVASGNQVVRLRIEKNIGACHRRRKCRRASDRERRCLRDGPSGGEVEIAGSGVDRLTDRERAAGKECHITIS